MRNKKQILMIASLIIIIGGLTGCGTSSTKKVVNTTTTQVNNVNTKVEDKQEALKKELQPLLLNFASAGLTFDYTTYTVDDYKKIKTFETQDSQKLEIDKKFTDKLNSIKNAKGIANVEIITINSIEQRNENIVDVIFTAKQNVKSYVENGKDYSNSVDNVKISATLVKENGQFLVDSYAFDIK
ncbi:hypothetical protein IAI10_23090 [Clostridium sp. 19966]|uniref:hypothetical protein n=1 Tax=Clostridium sp. 19966 TaxID=2768166 RepID=UPI0028DF6353|nr:hypothetical protein [Clostridium sp. 19966]MDT8719535.1 hypothetical protein [Clostridium sp. 19966]